MNSWHTQPSVVEPEVLPLLYVASIINSVHKVHIFRVINDTDHSDLIANQKCVPELKNASFSARCCDHVIAIFLLLPELNLWRHARKEKVSLFKVYKASNWIVSNLSLPSRNLLVWMLFWAVGQLLLLGNVWIVWALFVWTGAILRDADWHLTFWYLRPMRCFGLL